METPADQRWSLDGRDSCRFRLSSDSSQDPQPAHPYTIQLGQSLALCAILSLTRDADEFAYFAFPQPSASVAIEVHVSRIPCLARWAMHGLA